MGQAVLVLNQNYEPLNVCHAHRAVVLLISGKAEIVLNGRGHFKTCTGKFPRPSVIRLAHQVHRPRPHLKLSRRGVFRRYGLPDVHAPTERIYVSRRRARWRRVLNEDALMAVLARYGFRLVELEALSFREQVELFHRLGLQVPELPGLFHDLGQKELPLTLTAAEVSPKMAPGQIRDILLGLLVAGGLLIPGNIPNIISAGKLKMMRAATATMMAAFSTFRSCAGL